jgi:hypothetical protein
MWGIYLLIAHVNLKLDTDVLYKQKGSSTTALKQLQEAAKVRPWFLLRVEGSVLKSYRTDLATNVCLIKLVYDVK